jgi:hypothetical protein
LRLEMEKKQYFARARIGSSSFFIGINDERLLLLSDSEAK